MASLFLLLFFRCFDAVEDSELFFILPGHFAILQHVTITDEKSFFSQVEVIQQNVVNQFKFWGARPQPFHKLLPQHDSFRT